MTLWLKGDALMNNKMRILALLLIGTAVLISAQQKSEKVLPLKHSLKVYEDNERNCLYWPLGKEFWIRIAESPDSGAPSYLLSQETDSQEVESDVNIDKKATKNGIKLDVTGKQAIRWYNMVTGKKYKLRFYSDGDAPECEIKLSGASLHVQDNITYSGKGILCEIISSDKHSGVGKSYISVNNAQFKPYEKTINFSKEMKYNIYAYAVDNVGNRSNLAFTEFVVDMSAPETKVIAGGLSAENKTILSSNHSIEISAKDSLSGVKKTWYRFEKEKKFNLYNGPVDLKKLKDGDQQVLVFYSEDYVGNIEKPKQFAFVIDNTPPLGKIICKGDVHSKTNEQIIVSPRTMFKVEAKDERSEIRDIYYAVNKSKSVPFKAPFCISGEPGKYLITARVVDKLGNENSQISSNVVLDSKPPKSSHSFIGSVHKNEYTLWITPSTKIKLNAQDDLSGIKSIEYLFEGDSYITYKEPFNIKKEGLFILKYRGTDNVNNREEDRMIAVVVDSTPPVVEETFSSKPMSDDKSLLRFKDATTMFLKVIDDASGVKEVTFSINGGREQKYTGPIQFANVGSYNVEVRAKDNLENTQKKLLKFAIDK